MPRNCYLCLLNSKPSKRPQWHNNHHISLHKFPKDVRIRKAWFKACGLSEETDDVSKVTICSVHFTANDYIEPNAKIIRGKMCLKREAVPSVSVPHPPSPCTLKRNEMPLLATHTIMVTKPESSPFISTAVAGELIIRSDILAPQSEQCYTAGAESRETSQTSKKGKLTEPSPVVDVLNESLSTSRLKEVQLLATQSVVVTQPESGLFTPTAVAGKLIIRSDIIAPQSELCNTASVESEETTHTSNKRKFAEPRYISEIEVSDMATPKKAKRILSLVRRIDSEKLKKIKSLQNKNRYLLKRMASLKELVKFLNDKGLIAEEAKNILMVHMYKSHQFKNMHIK
ncbi:uncharacterized protein [Tenebrio molitor]|uniref:uncharacterized protein isoform X1 n=1 Tax=Tenebrio molitor TaxID=7067 RepID=UPI0036246B41